MYPLIPSFFEVQSRCQSVVPFLFSLSFFSISQDTPPSALRDHQRLYREIFPDLYARVRRVSFIKAVSKCPTLHLLLEGRDLISFSIQVSCPEGRLKRSLKCFICLLVGVLYYMNIPPLIEGVAMQTPGGVGMCIYEKSLFMQVCDQLSGF